MENNETVNQRVSQLGSFMNMNENLTSPSYYSSFFDAHILTDINNIVRFKYSLDLLIENVQEIRTNGQIINEFELEEILNRYLTDFVHHSIKHIVSAINNNKEYGSHVRYYELPNMIELSKVLLRDGSDAITNQDIAHILIYSLAPHLTLDIFNYHKTYKIDASYEETNAKVVNVQNNINHNIEVGLAPMVVEYLKIISGLLKTGGNL